MLKNVIRFNFYVENGGLILERGLQIEGDLQLQVLRYSRNSQLQFLCLHKDSFF